MIIENSIGWCDETTNAVTGCDKVSPGCKNCYAQVGTRARVLRAQGVETWGANGVRHPVAGFAATIRRLNRYRICDRCHNTEPVGSDDCRKCQDSTLRRIRLFADSNSDWLDEMWEIATLAGFLKEIHDAPNVDVLVLTKRITNFSSRLESAQDWHFDHGDRNVAGWLSDWRKHGIAPANVWLGVSVEDQQRADERIPFLAKTPAQVRFISAEPLLEAINLQYPETLFPEGPPHCCNGKDCGCLGRPIDPPLIHGINWLIVGAESGKNRRDCGLAAILLVVAQCHDEEIPVYVKQDCAFKSGQQGRIPNEVWSMKQFPTI